MYASAPGKILWIGGYSVLEKGNVSFVTGVDKRVHVKAEKLDNGKIHIISKQFDIDISGEFDGIKIVFDKDLSESEKRYSKFVVIAAETCLGYLKYKGCGVSGLYIETISAPAFGFGDAKSGLGSSAAVTTAVTGAIFELHGLRIGKNLDLIHKMAQYVHFRAQGKVGSGFDIAASCFGGHAYSRYSPELIKDIPEDAPIEQIAKVVEGKWDYSCEKLDMPHGFVTAMGNFAGQSASTSEMVKKINEWKAANPDGYSKLMRGLDGANREAIRWLKEINDGNEEAMEKFRHAFREGRSITKKLGELSGAPIEPDDFSGIIEETERNGAFVAKLPGAGGGDNISAICLSEAGKKSVEKYWASCMEKMIQPANISISNSGVRAEEESAYREAEKWI